MALTVTVVARRKTRNGQQIIADLTFDSSYPTGGEPLTAATLRARRIEFVDVHQKGAASRRVEYDYAAATLKLYALVEGVPNTYGEVANASDQSTIVCRASIFADHFNALKK